MSKYNIIFPDLSRIYRQYNTPRLIEVHDNSQFLLKLSLHRCAQYFQAEGYSDIVHYDMGEKGVVGFLFTDPNYSHAIGGCLFRKRKYENIDTPFVTMHWAWIHPFSRNKGLLSEHMDYFNEILGYWYPEYPHSKAMSSFVKKHNMISPSLKFKINP